MLHALQRVQRVNWHDAVPVVLLFSTSFLLENSDHGVGTAMIHEGYLGMQRPTTRDVVTSASGACDYAVDKADAWRFG